MWWLPGLMLMLMLPAMLTALAVIGGVLFTLSLRRFRSTISRMA